MVVETRVFFTFLEYVKGIIPGYYNHKEEAATLDDDVVTEQKRTNDGSESNNDVLRVHHLEKKFRK